MVAFVGAFVGLIGGMIWLVRSLSDAPKERGLRGKARRLETENKTLRDLVNRLHQRAVQGRDVDPVCAVFADEIEAVMHAEITFKTPGGYGSGERQKR